MENNRNSNKKPGRIRLRKLVYSGSFKKTGRIRLRESVYSGSFWSAIAAFAAEVSAIAVVIVIIQANDHYERQLFIDRAQFALQSINIKETHKKGVFVAHIQLQNIGRRSAERLVWAFLKHDKCNISGTLDVQKNAIQDPIQSGENFYLTLKESSFSISEETIYLPFAVSYIDRSLKQEFLQYFYPKLQWSSTKGTWDKMHATAKETVSKARLIRTALDKGIELALQLK